MKNKTVYHYSGFKLEVEDTTVSLKTYTQFMY